jgi:hypothetical protein
MIWLVASIAARIGLARLGRALSHSATAEIAGGGRPERTDQAQPAAQATGRLVVAHDVATDGDLLAAPRETPDPVAEIDHHLRVTAAAAAAGVALLALAGLLMTTPAELVFFACVMGGGFLVASAVGRVWAVGGVQPSRWNGARVSIWRVASGEDDEDWEGFSHWFYVRLTLITSTDPEDQRTTLSAPVRFFPPTPGTGKEWAGRTVQVIEMPGIAVIGLVGRRYHRMGGDDPWDVFDFWEPPKVERERSAHNLRHELWPYWPLQR